MPNIIRRDLLKGAAATVAQTALGSVVPSGAFARQRTSITYYPTIFGFGGHTGTSQTLTGNCYANVGLGRDVFPSTLNHHLDRATQNIRVPGTFSNLSWGLNCVSASIDTSVTLKLNVNGNPTPLKVLLDIETSGLVTDGTDTVTVSADDVLCFEANVRDDVIFSGSFYCASAKFVSSDASVQSAQMLATVGHTPIYPTDTQKFGSFIGILGGLSPADATTDESLQQFKCLTAGRWRNMACNIESSVFARNTIIVNRISAANGSMSINIPPNTSGYFEDTDDYDDVAAGDLLDYGILAGTSFSSTGSDHMEMDWVGAHFMASSPQQCMIGGTPQTPSPYAYVYVMDGAAFYSSLFGGGNFQARAPIRATGVLPYSATASEFSNHITSWNASSNAYVTFNLRDGNGMAVLSNSVANSNTGWFTASGSHTFAAGETCMNEIVLSGTQGDRMGWAGASLLLEAQ